MGALRVFAGREHYSHHTHHSQINHSRPDSVFEINCHQMTAACHQSINQSKLHLTSTMAAAFTCTRPAGRPPPRRCKCGKGSMAPCAAGDLRDLVSTRVPSASLPPLRRLLPSDARLLPPQSLLLLPLPLPLPPEACGRCKPPTIVVPAIVCGCCVCAMAAAACNCL